MRYLPSKNWTLNASLYFDIGGGLFNLSTLLNLLWSVYFLSIEFKVFTVFSESMPIPIEFYFVFNWVTCFAKPCFYQRIVEIVRRLENIRSGIMFTHQEFNQSIPFTLYFFLIANTPCSDALSFFRSWITIIN